MIAGLTGGGIHIQGYADDICVLAVGIFPDTMSGLMYWALHTAEIWCDEGGFLGNPDRTEYVVCTKRKKLPGFFKPHFLVVSHNPYPTAFPYGNGMVLHFYQQQESSTTKTVHKVINKGLKAYV